jgi:hypothetical protein
MVSDVSRHLSRRPGQHEGSVRDTRENVKQQRDVDARETMDDRTVARPQRLAAPATNALV